MESPESSDKLTVGKLPPKMVGQRESKFPVRKRANNRKDDQQVV